MRSVVLKNEDGVTPYHLQIIAGLSSGKTITEVAKEVGTSKSTIYYMLDNPEFKRELDKHVQKNITFLMLEGLNEISDIMKNSLSPKDKLEAFKIIAKMADFYSDSIKVSIEDKTKHNYQLEEILQEVEKTF